MHKNRDERRVRNVARCPKCGTEYIGVETDFEYGGVVLRGVRATKCPDCGEEFYTPEQYGAIQYNPAFTID